MEDYVEPLKEVDVKAHKDDDVNAPREMKLIHPRKSFLKRHQKVKIKVITWQVPPLLCEVLVPSNVFLATLEVVGSLTFPSK